MAYYHHVSAFQGPSEEGEPTIDEQIVTFEESIGQRVSAQSKANELFRASMIARGLDPDAKPELSPELAAKLEEDALKSDKDIFFGDTDREFRGRKLRDKDYEIE